jgi:hypothetical protein
MKPSICKLFGKSFLFIVALALGTAFEATWATAQEPSPISQCGTIRNNGSYILVNDLFAFDERDCLVIETGSVTIDLSGFVISGTTRGEGESGAGIRTTFGTVTVRNGTIAGFEVGVQLETDTSESIVEGVRAINNSAAGIIADGIISGNVAIGNGHGILVSGIVRGNIADDNAGFGIFVRGIGSIVSGNVTRENQIGISGACPSIFIGNTATNNTNSDLSLGLDCQDIDNLTPPLRRAPVQPPSIP